MFSLAERKAYSITGIKLKIVKKIYQFIFGLDH